MTSSKWNSCASVLLLHVLVVSFCCPPSYSQSKPTLKAPTRTSVIDRMFAHEFNQDKTGALTVGLFGLFWANTFNVHQQRGEPGGDAFSAGVIGTR